MIFISLFRRLLLCVIAVAKMVQANPIEVGQVLAFSPGIHGAVELIFESEVGKYYQVQISANMATWDNEGYSVKGTGGQISVLARTRSLANAFYRLRDDGLPENVAPVGPAGPQGEPGTDADGFSEGLSAQGVGHLVNSQAYSVMKLSQWRAGTFGGSPPLRGLQFGDSLSSGFALGPHMARAGIVGLGMTNLAGKIVHHGSGNQPFRFDYWINGQATEFDVGASAEFVEGSIVSGDVRGNEAFIAFIVRPGGGKFDLEYQQNRTGDWLKLAKINTEGPSAAGAVKTYSLSSSSLPFYRLRVTNVTDGSCVILFTGIYATDGGGVIWMPIAARGGIDVAQSVTTPAEIFDPVWKALAPDFVMTCWADAANEWEVGGAFRKFYEHATAIRSETDWILVSASPASDETGRPEQRIAQKAWAEESRQTWINGAAMFRDYATAVERGMMYDEVHLNEAGQGMRNAHLWSAIPLGQVPLGGGLGAGSGQPAVRLVPGGSMESSPLEIGRPLVIRSGVGYLSLYDRSSLLDGNRAWTLSNNASELGFGNGGANALVLATSLDLGVHPGGDGFKLGRKDRRWRGWFSGVQTGITTKSQDYTPSVFDHTILCDASAGRMTVSLPTADASNQGRVYVIKKIDPSINKVTVSAADGQTIDEKPTYVISSRMVFVEIQSSGSAWFVVGR